MKKDDVVRAEILRAAERLFQKWGLRKTTMEDIAAEAGKGKSSLYYYFKSREEVLESVALAQAARITERIIPEIEAQATARDKLRAYVRATFRGVREALTLYEIARGEIKADKDLIDGVIRKFNAVHEQIIASILRFGIERGELKTIAPRDLRATTRAILTVMRSLIINLFIESDDLQLIDRVIRLLADGL